MAARPRPLPPPHGFPATLRAARFADTDALYTLGILRPAPARRCGRTRNSPTGAQRGADHVRGKGSGRIENRQNGWSRESQNAGPVRDSRTVRLAVAVGAFLAQLIHPTIEFVFAPVLSIDKRIQLEVEL